MPDDNATSPELGRLLRFAAICRTNALAKIHAVPPEQRGPVLDAAVGLYELAAAVQREREAKCNAASACHFNDHDMSCPVLVARTTVRTVLTTLNNALAAMGM